MVVALNFSFVETQSETSGLVYCTCPDELIKNPISVLEVNIINQQLLDSLIIYDKDKSWEIKM